MPSIRMAFLPFIGSLLGASSATPGRPAWAGRFGVEDHEVDPPVPGAGGVAVVRHDGLVLGEPLDGEPRRVHAAGRSGRRGRPSARADRELPVVVKRKPSGADVVGVALDPDPVRERLDQGRRSGPRAPWSSVIRTARPLSNRSEPPIRITIPSLEREISSRSSIPVAIAKSESAVRTVE